MRAAPAAMLFHHPWLLASILSIPVVLPFPECNMVSAFGNVLLLLSNTACETHEVIVLLFFIGSFLFIAE